MDKQNIAVEQFGKALVIGFFILVVSYAGMMAIADWWLYGKKKIWSNPDEEPPTYDTGDETAELPVETD